MAEIHVVNMPARFTVTGAGFLDRDDRGRTAATIGASLTALTLTETSPIAVLVPSSTVS